MLRKLSSALLVLLAACSADPIAPSDAGAVANPDGGMAPQDAGEAPAVTFYRDVKPIIDGRCVSCHSPGNVGPFDLSQPEQVQPLATVIRAQVEARLMPPWHADGECREYKGDRSLTDEQIATISDWVDLGAPLGDPADATDPLPPVTQGLSRVDLRVGPSGAYEPSGLDEYRCFVVEWPEDTTKFVTGFNLEPSNPAVVHHANLFFIEPANAQAYRDQEAADPEPGYRCFGGVFGEGAGLLGAWAPGSLGIEFPQGTGIQLDPGSVIVMEMHFSTGPNRDGADRSEIALTLEDSVERRALIAPFWDFLNWSQGRQMRIPAGESDVVHQFDFDPEPYVPVLAPWLASRAIQIWATGMHMHYLGTSGKVHIVRSDESRECLIEIPRWDFGWQYGYLLQEPVDFTIGLDEFFLECHFDNSAENQPIIDGQQRTPRNVNWGGDSGDEMCIGYIYITER